MLQTIRVIIFALLSVLLITSFLANAKDADVQQDSQFELKTLTGLSSSELNREKSMLEVNKLAKEVSKFASKDESLSKSDIFQIITLFLAFGASGVSFWTVRQNNKNHASALKLQNDNAQKDRMFNLLRELGSDSAYVRAAATQTLADYPDTQPILINALKMEKDGRVVTTITDSFSKSPETALALLLDQTRQINTDKLKAAVGLVFHGDNSNQIAQVYSLINHEIVAFKNTRQSFRIERSYNEKQHASGALWPTIKAQEKAALVEDLNSLTVIQGRLMQAIEELLRNPVIKGKPQKFNRANLTGISLDGLDISGWDFEDAILHEATFYGTIAIGTKFDRIKATNINFRNATLEKASFSYAELKSVDMRGVDAEDSIFSNCNIFKMEINNTANFDGANFSQAKLSCIDIRNSDLRRVSFDNAKLYNATFDTCRMSENTFRNTRLILSKIHNVRMRRSVFSHASLVDVSLNKNIMIGVNLSDSTLKRVTQEDCTFV